MPIYTSDTKKRAMKSVIQICIRSPLLNYLRPAKVFSFYYKMIYPLEIIRISQAFHVILDSNNK